jgi:3-phytase
MVGASLLMPLFLVALSRPQAAPEPAAVFLTWSGDPTTTVTVDWHLLPGAEQRTVEVRGPGAAGWRKFSGEPVEFPHSRRTVRRALVTGLEPDVTYELRFSARGTFYRYRTMPAGGERIIRFATGGDTQYAEETFGVMNRAVAAYDLDFVLFGGDLSYANGDPRLVERKETWFETITRTLVAEGIRLIPVVAAIGNHEVWEQRRLEREDEDPKAFMAQWGVKERQATYYEHLFAFPRSKTYDVLDIGGYLSLVLLDSGHMEEVEGEQAEWLASVLAARRDVPHLFPVYHVPAYPSVRSFDGSTSRRIREHWVPLFERHGVRVVFENHDHVYKRTFPLRQGKVDPNAGVVYMGDGAWGVGTRQIGRDQGGEPAWYLERSASTNHAIIVTLDGPHQHFLTIDHNGAIVDEYPARPVRATASLPLMREDTVRAAVVTEPVLGDSDDPAIWIDARNPSRSIVLGTDKHDTNGGVYAFGLDGRIDRRRTVTGLERINNVDVAYGLRLGKREVDIAVATERNRMALRVFSLPDMRPIDGGGIPVFGGDTTRAPMGIALYRRPRDGAVFAIVGGKGGPSNGYLWQYRLEDDGRGRIRGIKVREFGAFSGKKEIEAIAVDDELGYVYYSDETAGIRKYHADPDKGDEELAFFGTTGFVRDHEGIAIYERDDGTGYILVSDQQGQRIQVFRREGDPGRPHAHSAIAVIPVSARDTDGLEVTSTPLGAAFPRGLLVLMSADRTFHYFRWEEIEALLPAPEAVASGVAP